MTSAVDDLAWLVRMLGDIRCKDREGVMRVIDGPPRMGHPAMAPQFRPLPTSRGSSHVVVRTRIVGPDVELMSAGLPIPGPGASSKGGRSKGSVRRLLRVAPELGCRKATGWQNPAYSPARLSAGL